MVSVVTADDVQARLAVVRDRIAGAGGDPDVITLVAVMKDHPEAYPAARAAGFRVFAENRAHLGGWLTEHHAHPDDELHFIGNVQRRDIPTLASFVTVWQTVSRIEVGESIAQHAPGADVFVQVNCSEEPQKHGISFVEAPLLVEKLQTLNLNVKGLMGMGPLGEPELARPGFRKLAQLAKTLDLAELSMGMTNDLEIAVQEGTTMVRIGSALFGPRSAI